MQNITQNGYNEMARYVEGINGDETEAGKLMRVAMLEAFAMGKKVGEMGLETDSQNDDCGRRREGDAGRGDKVQP